MDRAPLDLYAFSKSDAENLEKSKNIRALVTRDQSLQKGEILFIEASPATLVRRNMARGRPPKDAGSEEYFANQISGLKNVYQPSFVLSTEQHNTGEVARRVVRHVLLEAYRPTDLDKIIERYERE